MTQHDGLEWNALAPDASTAPMTQWRTWGRRTIVALIALATVVVALFAVLVPVHATLYGTVLPVAMLLGVAVCAAPLVALTHPRVAIAAFCTGAFVLPLVVAPDRDDRFPWPWSVPALLAFVVFVLVLTVVHGWRLGLIPLVVSSMGSLAAPLILPAAAPAAAVASDLIVTTSVAVAVYLIAVLLAGRIRVGEELTRERALTTIEHSRRVLVEERTRIARDLHDVVAHSMSLIQVQASTARYRIPDLSTPAVAEFDDIAATARSSLTEMRRLLGVLRTEQDAPALAPQQGLDDIPALVESIRRAGAEVGLRLELPQTAPPAAVQITAFRLVQEALSNAVRHAPGAHVEVVVGTTDAAVTVRVRNDPTAEATPRQPGAGHGLRGMRERVALVAGSLIVGPDPDGGWSVDAVLPWAAEEESA